MDTTEATYLSPYRRATTASSDLVVVCRFFRLWRNNRPRLHWVGLDADRLAEFLSVHGQDNAIGAGRGSAALTSAQVPHDPVQTGISWSGQLARRLAGVVEHLDPGFAGLLVEGQVDLRAPRRVLADEAAMADAVHRAAGRL